MVFKLERPRHRKYEAAAVGGVFNPHVLLSFSSRVASTVTVLYGVEVRRRSRTVMTDCIENNGAMRAP